eukprot:9494756-Pyramimonas_sp.AAC.1
MTSLQILTRLQQRTSPPAVRYNYLASTPSCPYIFGFLDLLGRVSGVRSSQPHRNTSRVQTTTPNVCDSLAGGHPKKKAAR